MELGVYTFAETTPDPSTGKTIDTAQRLRDLIEEIELADQLGLDVFGIGEHHRADFSASAPAIILAAAAERTKRIKLTTAVTVLSSDDPVRVYQQFATLDLLSGGRAEIMAGRGSFIESFPLFGYDLDDYDDLFSEKLDLLLKIRDSERVTWSGTLRAPLSNQPVYPRTRRDLPIWVGVGGNPPSAARAGRLWRLRSSAACLSAFWASSICSGKQRARPATIGNICRSGSTPTAMSRTCRSAQRTNSFRATPPR